MKTLVQKAYQRGHLLTLKNPMYKAWIERFIIEEIKGDVGKKGDITSDAILKKNPVVKATIYTRQKGVVAGIEEVVFLYKRSKVDVKRVKKDGQRIKRGDILLKLEGKEKDLLRVERSALDILQRMSGIATLTSFLIKKTKGKVGIAPTRKTQWRYLDKKAVYKGGGLTHRLALWESIIIKDNHVKAIKKEGVTRPTEEAIKRAWKNKNGANFIEMEVTNKKESIRAAESFSKIAKNYPFLIMFDNMQPSLIKKSIKEIENKNLIFEASGGITAKNIGAYVKTGVDVISLGYLTHSSKALDIKQHIL